MWNPVPGALCLQPSRALGVCKVPLWLGLAWQESLGVQISFHLTQDCSAVLRPCWAFVWQRKACLSSAGNAGSARNPPAWMFGFTPELPGDWLSSVSTASTRRFPLCLSSPGAEGQVRCIFLWILSWPEPNCEFHLPSGWTQAELTDNRTYRPLWNVLADCQFCGAGHCKTRCSACLFSLTTAARRNTAVWSAPLGC